MGRDAGPPARCGVFADPGAPAGGDGSKASPFSSLQAAVTRAATAGLPVLACGKVFAEHVDVPAGVVVYGALDCDHGWAWTGSTRTTIAPAAAGSTPGASEIALQLEAGEGTVIEDVDVLAPDGAAPGASSIAVLAVGATARLVRCGLTAGKGADGAAGAAGNAASLDGLPGIPGTDVCTTVSEQPRRRRRDADVCDRG